MIKISDIVRQGFDVMHNNDEWFPEEIPLNENYGIPFPEGTNQLVKELYCLKLSRFRKNRKLYPELRDTEYYAINCIRMLWPQRLAFYKDIYTSQGHKRIWNNYIINIIRFLSRNKWSMLTGPASSSKTFITSAYLLIS